MRSLLVPSIILVVAACASSPAADGVIEAQTQQNDAGGATQADSGEPGANSEQGPSFTFEAGPDPRADAEADIACSDDAKNKMFVVSDDNYLWSFEPATLTFTQIGIINCTTVDPTAGGRGVSPHSMAIDRHGYAWVNFTNGDTYKVDTRTAACSSTGTTYKNTKYSLITLGFSTDSVTAANDSLFLTGPTINGPFLGKINPVTLEASTVGSLVGDLVQDSNTHTELTGTGDGRLYGFLKNPDGNPMQLTSIRKDNAQVTKIAEIEGTYPGAYTTAYAFSFWGGDIWFFFAANNTDQDHNPSQVIQYKASSDNSQTVVMDTSQIGGFEITGAGVSTCAPLTPPVVK